MQASSKDEYLNPTPGETIDYRADRGSEDPRTPNSEVPEKWDEWKKESERRELKYFIPDWDDLVDPRYDFEEERYSNSTGPEDRGSGGWENEVFAHQLYDTPSYDGILVSREVLQKSKKKKRALEELADGNGGVHRYLRVPKSFPVMGDCGAFGYVNKKEPPYSVDDVLNYYTRHGFNLGVSVDHLVYGASDKEGRKYRYDLTLQNAQEFIDKHEAQGRQWTPMAAVQGWDIESYVDAATECVGMGYDYLAVGGLVRTSTEDILHILSQIREAVGSGIDLHALGVARLATISDFLKIGVTSVDSATYLRRAWTSRKDNYWTRDELVFSAVRVPGAKRSLRKMARDEAEEETKQDLDQEEVRLGTSLSKEEREKRIEAAKEEKVSKVLEDRLNEAKRLRERCFKELRAYGAREEGALDTGKVLNLLDEYQTFVGRDCLREHYWATLRARPWEDCDCAICLRNGIEVLIFSGNNRNRRRGFHNTRVFYDLLGRVLKTEESVHVERGKTAFPMPTWMEKEGAQYPLFNPEAR
jgi:hypothetical protein